MSKSVEQFAETNSSITDKNQTRTDFSTFIQDIESTTQKLLSQVFSTPIFPKSDKSNYSSNQQYNSRPPPQPQQQLYAYHHQHHPVQPQPQHQLHISSRHSQFFRRVDYFEQTKQSNLDRLRRTVEQSLQKQCTHFPATNQTSVEVTPIQERFAEVIRSKERKLQAKRIQARVERQREIKRFPFKPRINGVPGLERTFEEYYQQKQKWDRRRQQSLEKKRQIDLIKRNQQCTFKPEIQTRLSKFYKQNVRKNKHMKVEDRLIHSLEQSYDRKRLAQGS